MELMGVVTSLPIEYNLLPAIEKDHESLEADNDSLESSDYHAFVEELDPIDTIFSCLLTHWGTIDNVYRHYANLNARSPFRCSSKIDFRVTFKPSILSVLHSTSSLISLLPSFFLSSFCLFCCGS